jgi:hypothetical protein
VPRRSVISGNEFFSLAKPSSIPLVQTAKGASAFLKKCACLLSEFGHCHYIFGIQLRVKSCLENFYLCRCMNERVLDIAMSCNFMTFIILLQSVHLFCMLGKIPCLPALIRGAASRMLLFIIITNYYNITQVITITSSIYVCY